VKEGQVLDKKGYIKLGLKLLLVCGALFSFFSNQNTTFNNSEGTDYSIEHISSIKISSFDNADYSQVMEDRVDEKNNLDQDIDISIREIQGKIFSQIPYKAVRYSQLTFRSKYRIYDINCCWKYDLA
jgi:hypothetical protein